MGLCNMNIQFMAIVFHKVFAVSAQKWEWCWTRRDEENRKKMRKVYAGHRPHAIMRGPYWQAGKSLTWAR